jgi:hypothetical protein
MAIRDRHASPDWRTGTQADETWGRAGFEGLSAIGVLRFVLEPVCLCRYVEPDLFSPSALLSGLDRQI